MELKSLLLGLAFTVGIFAIKSGAGLSYLFEKHKGWTHIFKITTVFALSYGLMFYLSWLIVVKIDFLFHLRALMTLFKGGMLVHFLIALLLLWWGARLLLRGPVQQPSRGWLLLVIPCPVCFTVFLCSSALLENLSGGNVLAMAVLFAGYLFISGVTAAILYFLRPEHKEHMLGSIMVLAALYFLLTVLIVPQFSDIERIYRLSGGRDLSPIENSAYVITLLTASLAVGIIRTIWRPMWK